MLVAKLEFIIDVEGFQDSGAETLDCLGRRDEGLALEREELLFQLDKAVAGGDPVLFSLLELVGGRGGFLGLFARHDIWMRGSQDSEAVECQEGASWMSRPPGVLGLFIAIRKRMTGEKETKGDWQRSYFAVAEVG